MMETDIWGQLALEASSGYMTDGTILSPFFETVFRIVIFLFVPPVLVNEEHRMNFNMSGRYDIIISQLFL